MIKNKSPFTINELKKFQKCTTGKLSIIIEVVIFAIFSFLALLLILVGDFNTLVELIIMGTVILIVYPLALMLLYKINEKNQTNLMSDDSYNIYVFTDENIKEESYKKDTMVSSGEVRYALILKCVDYKDMLYLYIAKNQAFMISKNGFVEGSVEDLYMILVSHNIKIIKK